MRTEASQEDCFRLELGVPRDGKRPLAQSVKFSCASRYVQLRRVCRRAASLKSVALTEWAATSLWNNAPTATLEAYSLELTRFRGALVQMKEGARYLSSDEMRPDPAL